MTDSKGLLAGAERRLAAARGWRRWGLALLLGALAGLAFAPLFLFPLLIVGLTGLVWLIDERRPALASFSAGWWWGFGHFLVGFYWVAEALLVDAGRFGWMIPFVVGGLAGGMALFIGLVALVTRRLNLGGPAKVLAFAVLWTAAEWLRGHLLSGFPWNLAGYSLAFSDALIQYAALGGVWGLSLIVVALAAMPATLAEGTRRLGMWCCAGALLVALLLAAGGAVRLAAADRAMVPGVLLRIVQPAIPQAMKWEGNLREQHVALEREMTASVSGWEHISAAIWPETAVPFLVERDPRLRQWLGAAVPPGALLLTGAPRGEPAQGDLERIYNSLVAIDHDGNLIGSTDKFHLVPLGEYVPLRKWLPFLSKITPGEMDFTAGPGPRTLNLPGLPPVGPLICYEVIFPGQVVDPANRPHWLLNVTNDGWFGSSSGPYQHFASARLRAIEEGLPLVRSANTGISGLIDPYGRVLVEIPLGHSAVRDVPLPVAIAVPPFGRLGDWLLAFQLLIVSGIAWVVRRSGSFITGN
ncbi:MAG: apolipoprotein N-acyltransferase [Rhodospirillaceae bacterium]|nr:apolipoprotein N-acyltransferase [Rhodospirillaceae bacterium]